MIENPCRELKEYRPYYVELSGDSTFEDEGYLIYSFNDYMRERFKLEDIDPLSLELAERYLKIYSNIIQNKIKIPSASASQ